jgi:hypothetical protein
MKALTKISTLLVFAIIVAQTSCSVTYRQRHPRRHRVIVVPMNEKKTPSTTTMYQPSEQLNDNPGVAK